MAASVRLRSSSSAASIFNDLPHRLYQKREFIAARVKWIRDPYLDDAVLREKNLKQIFSLKDRIVSSPSKSLSLASLSFLKPHLDLPTTASSFFLKYPSVFTQFQPCPSMPLHVRLAPQALSLHKEEQEIHDSPDHRNDAVRRLAKLLMLARNGKLPLHIVDKFRFDMGLPHDYITSLIPDYPDYFDVSEITDCLTGQNTLGLVNVSWKSGLAVSEMEKREGNGRISLKKGLPIRYSMELPKGYELEKRVSLWVDQWQNLPYISPYENAFHLGSSSDQADKWTVAVLHELLWLLASKKTEKDNLICLGDYLGFGRRFRNALKHFPGIFYVSNKIRTQTVVLREGYRKNFLVEKHPMMGMRHRYIYLMNKSVKKRKKQDIIKPWSRRKIYSSSKEQVFSTESNDEKSVHLVS